MTQIGQVIPVVVGGQTYDTVIDSEGNQRFVKDPILYALFQADCLDFGAIHRAYSQGKIPQRTYLEFNMAIGYSVGGLAELSSFQNLEIINPLWETTKA